MPTTTPYSIFDEKNIHSCPWPSDQEGEFARKFLSPLISDGIFQFVENIHAKMVVLFADGQIIPLTINERHYDNSYVASPYSYYVTCASSGAEKIKNRLIRSSFEFFLKFYSAFMRWGKIDKAVVVNNWLWTTNPYPNLTEEQVVDISKFLAKAYPGHALVFRTVNKKTCINALETLKNAGYDLIASKYIYITDGADEETFKTRIFKSDLKFIKESPFTLESINDGDLNKIHHLYRSLYIDKYSSLSPQYNTKFIDLLLKSGALNMLAVKKGDDVAGVAGYFCKDGAMISPFFGYDPEASPEKGVYRFLSAQLMIEAQKRKAIFNQSAGGSFFKEIRRAKQELEYTAIYQKHLPLSRRLPWKVLSFLINTLGRRLMGKY